MKLLVFFALIAYASASVLYGPQHAEVVAPVVHAPALLSTGTSSSSRTQDSAGNYAFAYNEQHATGGSSRRESGAPGVATGSYTLNVADGRQRVVNYVADALGFRAAIATNEPGTAAAPAASTAISSPHLPPVAPVAVAHAPVVEVAAPLVHAAPVAVAHHAPLLHAAPVAVAHHAPLLAAPVHAPVHVAAPVAVAHVPAVSSYSTAINHASLALPAVHHVAAPVLAHGHLAAPLLAHHGGHLGAPLAHY